MSEAMLKLTVYIPGEALEAVKAALFAAGAGSIGNYAHCCWQIEGRGQFKALDGSDPYLGEPGKMETVREWRVEMVVAKECIDAVIAALKASHPYETPAYDVVAMLDY